MSAVRTNGTGYADTGFADGVLRVVIADDDEAGRVLLRTLIELEPGFRLVGEAATGTRRLRR